MKIAVIGAGPRGLSLIERLLAKTRILNKSIEIDIFDNYPIGGRVWNWQNEHNKKFLMNTPVEQVTLFPDESVRDIENIAKGPSIYQWITTGEAKKYLKQRLDIDGFYKEHINELASNSHCVRGLMGVYSEWFFALQKEQLSEFQKLTYFPYEVINVEEKENGYSVIFANDKKEYDYVILAPGHIQSKEKTSEQIEKYAKDNNLKYYPASNPADIDFSEIEDNANVFVKGLGLSFYDYMYELATMKGGYFEKIAEDKLQYHPTGKEAKLYVGSRSSIPMNARAINYKGVFWEYNSRYFNLEKLKQQYNVDNKLALDDFLTLIRQELLYNYLQFNFEKNDCYEKIVDLKNNSNSLDQLLDFAKQEDITIPAIIENITDLTKWPYLNESKFEENLTNNINEDIKNALLGNFESKFAIIFESLKEIRDVIRDLVELDLLTAEAMQYLNNNFKRIDNRLSVGPPVIRVQQMKALLESGMLHIISDFNVACEDGKFVLKTKDTKVEASYLIEARLGKISIQDADDNLMKNLYQNNILTNAKYSSNDYIYETNAVLIDKRSFQVIDQTNKKHNNLFVFGIPTDGYVWFTTSLPRPYANAMIFRESERIAKTILDTQR